MKILEQAKLDSVAEHRTIEGQGEFWAQVRRTSLENPDFPVDYIVHSLTSLKESREVSIPFIPESSRG
jgi:hypothetical protein